jgi:hypothetical protein
MAKLRITAGRTSLDVELLDTPTARAVLAALPFESKAQTWGAEVYFEAPVQAALEPDARQVVDPGTVCFWVEGSSLALPFGPTPASIQSEPRLVTRCNVLGKVIGDPRVLAGIRAGERVNVERA